MASTNSKQMTNGKSFEYALLVTFEEKLKDKTNLEVIKSSAFHVAKSCFDSVSASEKSEYLLSASFAVNFLMDIEPRLSHDLGNDDVLQLEILPDHHGKSGDVRDVLAIRLLQKWEIGVSAKNNSEAAKHSRLSSSIDFGEQWLGMKASRAYFDTVTPIFDSLEKIRKESNKSTKWSELTDHHATIYVPILNAFITELQALSKKDPQKVASNLVANIVGNKDFYKVIKRKRHVEVHAYNMNGTLNAPFRDILPVYEAPRVPLPTKIVKTSLKSDSNTTAIIEMDNDWTLSFRIHNASSEVEPSLKFDINLLKSPKILFKNKLDIIRA